MPVCYGTGSNGKSTILGALIDIFGPDYGMKAAPDLLMAKAHEGHPTDRTDLFGKRLVVAIETEEGRRLSETQVKEYTGGDRIRARRMRENFWEFSPTHTVFLATNHKPEIRGVDHGIWRRVKLVPFAVTVADKDAVKDMPVKLRAEAQGILAWCVRGCLKWQANGLTPPEIVTAATAIYRKEQDKFGRFLEQHFEQKVGARTKAGEAYQRYKRWAEDGHEFVMSLTKFGVAIRERGIGCDDSGRFVFYLDIELKPEPPIRHGGL
jgi:putative DNA primase/helicase